MISLSVTIDAASTLAGLGRIQNVEGVLRKETGDLGTAYKAALLKATPRGKGENSPNLVRRYETDAHYSKDTAEYSIKNQVPYLKYVLNGRGPVHAKNGKALRFVIGGRVFYRVSVKGAKANDFPKRVRAEMRGQVAEAGRRMRQGIVARFKQ